MITMFLLLYNIFIYCIQHYTELLKITKFYNTVYEKKTFQMMVDEIHHVHMKGIPLYSNGLFI